MTQAPPQEQTCTPPIEGVDALKTILVLMSLIVAGAIKDLVAVADLMAHYQSFFSRNWRFPSYF